MTRPCPTPSFDRRSEGGYSLAALIVILTIMAVAIAYTVPDSWSRIMKREREYQTQFAMKQYARAIQEFQRRTGGLPVTMEQLEKQNTPRVLRKPMPNPLSGEMDWILIPPGQAQQPGQPPPQPGQPGQPGQPQAQQPGGGVPSSPFAPDPDASSYVGPFVGVRPPQKGEAIVPLNDRTRYEEWSYTILDLQQEQNPGQPAGGPIVSPQQPGGSQPLPPAPTPPPGPGN